MRIICDHCDRPISGTVKRMPEHLNFHADCLAKLAEETKKDSPDLSWQNQEASAGWVDSKIDKEEPGATV